MNNNHFIASNTIKCLKCGDVIYSAHVHDYKTCKCGAVAVDGGSEYLKRTGTSYQELSIVIDRKLAEAINKDVSQAEADGKNAWGIALTVLRTIRDNGYIEALEALK